FAECLNPVECIPDAYGAVAEIRCEYQVQENGRWKSSGEFVTLPARAVMIAAGTHPATTYHGDHPGTVQLEDRGEFYQGHTLRQTGGVQHLVVASPGEIGFFTSYEKQGRYVTFFGDNHPHYAGNVVKAMASAKDGFPEIARVFQEEIRRL